jgi:O-antigen/teichoic acid export membrane protein
MKELSTQVLMRQNLFGVIQGFVGFCSNFVLAVILPIVMGAFMFGQFSIVVGLGYFLAGIFDSGFNMTTIRFISQYSTTKKYNKLKSTFFHLLKYKLGLATIFAAILALLSFQVTELYSLGNQVPTILLVSILIIVYSLVTFLSAVFVGLNKNQYSLMGNGLNSVFLIALPVMFFYLKGDLFWIVAGVLIAFIIAAIFLAFELATRFRQLFPAKSTPAEKNELNRNVINFTVISLFSLFLFWGLILILGIFVAADKVAFFKIAISWFAATGLIIPISTQILFSSVISFKASNDLKRLQNYLNTILRYSLIIIIPLVVGVFFFGERLVQIIYGAEFLEAGSTLKLMIFALFFSFISNIFSSTLVAYGRINKLTKMYLFNLIFGTVLAFVLIYYFGLLGGIATFIITNVLLSAFLIKMSSFMKFRLKEAIARPAFVSLLMAAFLFYAQPYAVSALSAISVVLTAIVFYFVLLYLMKGITRDDLRLLRYLK